ncbi:NAD(P)/FAD-dependent oxidoreductase [Streptomyces ardesiacus]|uniref:NAD(P)/FAD-dependent oxidoreductase n=1 Tax=Streptomyces ardesiacus TaxID=285564 RepID=UPI000D596AAA|nr:FAD-dependent monooxygenase [Streptomyces ardesiacus]
MPDIATPRRPTAVVIGASAAGLFAAAALADYADVTIVERDVLPGGPEPRRGVPQARHAHLVWSGGVLAFEDLLPGVIDDVVAKGGRLVDIMRDMVSRAPNEVWFRRFTNGYHRNLVCSRDLLDSVLRAHVLALHSVTVRQDTTVLGLEGTASRVTGVRVRTDDDESTLSADLIVDASGRGSHAPRWLTALGLPVVTEREVNAGVAYATRIYRAPGTTANTRFPLINVQANPEKAPGQGGIILPVEDNRWIVTLSGTRGGEPTADPEAFRAFALGLGDPIIGELLEHADPLSDIATTRSTANRRRYYEKLPAWPDGFLVLGDAIAGYNPVYGHGLTVAAQCALAVREGIRRHRITEPGTARALQRAAAKPVAAAWDLAVGQDAFYPGASDTPPTAAERFLARFVDRAVETGASNPRALAALLDVMSLEKPATRLFSPDMLRPMLIGPRKPPLDGPPITDAERRAAST